MQDAINSYSHAFERRRVVHVRTDCAAELNMVRIGRVGVAVAVDKDATIGFNRSGIHPPTIPGLQGGRPVVDGAGALRDGRIFSVSPRRDARRGGVRRRRS